MESFTRPQIDALSKICNPGSIFHRPVQPRASHQGYLPPQGQTAGRNHLACQHRRGGHHPWLHLYCKAFPSRPGAPVPAPKATHCPSHGGLVMDMTRMDRIIAIRPQDLQADVQPGVFRKTLNGHAGRSGLFFPAGPRGRRHHWRYDRQQCFGCADHPLRCYPGLRDAPEWWCCPTAG
jgi:hypothetical protein